jgi:YegS/Rv2252/BmrU family lipid kinase
MARRILFIINPAAGAAQRWPAFDRAARTEGLSSDQILTADAGEAACLAQKFAAEYDVLAAVGGDGTISEVANGLVLSGARQCALGIVPAGTGNDAAAAVGIRAEDHALRILLFGRPRPIDLIEVSCQIDRKPGLRYALLFAGVGIVCESLKRTTRTLKRLFGHRRAYPVGLLRALWTYQAPRMRVSVGGQSFERPFLFAGASNTECAGGGMKIAPGAEIDDGMLNLNLIEKVGRWEALKQLRALCSGLHIHRPYVQYLVGHNLTIHAELSLEVAADGELIGHTPAQFTIKPKALQVLAP